MTGLLDDALAYAELGWPVFPTDRTTKAPLTRNGFHDASTDPAQLRGWWARRPDANVAGVVPMGTFVLDVDPRNGGAETMSRWVEECGPMPETLTALTGGGGLHLYGLDPGGDLRTERDCGIDLKRAGRGYLVLPPSLHASGSRYEWLEATCPVAEPPAWLVELLRPPPVVSRLTTDQVGNAFPTAVCGGGSMSAELDREPPRVGDDFNARHSCAEVLLGAGWEEGRKRPGRRNFTRPGKLTKDGPSASVYEDKGRCTIFSSSVDVERVGQGSYDPFGLWAALHCKGDLTEATKLLAERGYGS